MLKNLKKYHIFLLNYFQKSTGFSNYQMLWLMFFEGLLLGFLLAFILF